LATEKERVHANNDIKKREDRTRNTPHAHKKATKHNEKKKGVVFKKRGGKKPARPSEEGYMLVAQTRYAGAAGGKHPGPSLGKEMQSVQEREKG